MEWSSVAVLVATFAMLLAAGVPIAVSIGLSTIATMLVTMPIDPALTTAAERLATGLDSFALLAIPFFILAGQIMNRGGIARRLIDFAKAVVGMFPGGLAYVNILAAMLMGAISGSAVAAVSAIGGIMGPRMDAEGYDKGFSAAVNMAAGPTGLLIPPSNILIVYSLASGGESVAALFMAGYLPGILLGLLLMIVSGWIAFRRGYPAAGRVSIGEALRLFARALPSLFLIVLVIGGITSGVFTATEAAAIAVVYALVLSLFYGEIRVADLPHILRESGVTTAVVMLLIGTSMGMSWILAYENIPQTVSATLLGVSESPIVILLLINLILLVVGTFMDMTPAVLIFTPIFLPLAVRMGISPVHFGIIMVLNLCIGLCTPPVGSVLFVGCGVAGIPVTRAIRPLLPLFLAMVAALFLVTYVPAISLWLPRLVGY
ncbi:MAG: TRAP transporter large permease [Planctomycetes bacterium]|nr:TRAP transporter large permease [Planctomycetota bacterium]